MKINKPIIFFDLETTGTNVDQDRIVQIHTTKIHPDGSKESKTRLVNPTIPIPTEASDVHGITDDMVKNEPPFKRIAKGMAEFFHGCDLAGYNSNRFDVPLLITEFGRAGIEFPTWDPVLIDGHALETILNPRTLSAVFERYTGIPLDDAHDAGADVAGTITVLDHQMEAIRERFPDVLNPDGTITPENLEKFVTDGKTRFDYSGKCYVNDDGVVCWNFGPHRNKPVLENKGFLGWVFKNDFPSETKTKLQKLISGEFRHMNHGIAKENDAINAFNRQTKNQ